MEDILALIQNLPKASIQNISRSTLRHSSRGSTDTRLNKFFKLVAKYRKRDDGFYIKKLFINPNKNNFSLLKHRVKRKIIEALTSENNILRNSNLDKIDKELYLSTRYLFTAKMLLRMSGNSKAALDLIGKAEKKGKLFEFYSILSDCLLTKKYQSSLIKSPKDFETVNAEIERIQFIQKLTNKANDYYFKFIVNARQLAINLDDKEIQKKLLDAIYELKKDQAYTNSPLSKYYILLLEMEYYDKRKEYAAGLEVCKELKQVITTNPSVLKKQRLGTAEINLGFFQSKLSDFKESLRSIENAIRYTIPESNNNLLYREYEVMLLIYLNDIDAAHNKIRQLIRLTQNNPKSLRHSRCLFIRGVILYKYGKTKEALSLISKNTVLEADMSGWGIQQRLLQIILALKVNKTDLADNFLLNLKRKFHQFPPAITTNLRIELIFTLLCNLHKEGFQTSKISNTSHSILVKLSKQKGLISWSPMEPEIIPINEEIAKIYGIILSRKTALATRNI